jgi:hypothetical protein
MLRRHATATVAFLGAWLASAALARAQTSIHEEVRRDEMADLAVKALTPSPLFPHPGETVDVVVYVRNRALRPARKVAVVLFAGRDLVTTADVDFEPGGVATLRLPWKAPSVGAYTLTAVLDPARKLVEMERHDNQASTEVVVAPSPARGADVAITGLEAIVAPDRPGLLRVTVHNSGSAAAQVPVALRAGDGTTAVRLVGPISPGSPAVVEVPWARPAVQARFSAEINPRHRGDEVDPRDNSFDRDLRPALDLRVEGLSGFAAQPELGRPKEVTITFRVLNAGRNEITMPFRTAVTITPAGAQPHYITTPRLAAGQSVYVAQTVGVRAEEFDVRVEADADRVMGEDDRANNIATWHYKNPTPDVGRWVSIGPRRMTVGMGSVGLLGAIAIDPKSPSTIYVGSPHGSGVWKTADGGSSWKPVADSFPTLSVCSIAIDPSASARVYVANPHGVFRSEDGGASWVQVNGNTLSGGGTLDPVAWGGVLLVDPANPNVLYLSSTKGVCRSGDRGASWTLSLGGGLDTELILVPSKPGTLYATLGGGSNSGITGIYRTSDGGTSWEKLTGAPAGPLPTVTEDTTISLARSGGTLYAAYKMAKSFKLYRTTGVTSKVGGRLEDQWELRWSPPENLGQSLFNGIDADPVDPRYVYASGVNFWVSTDGGKTFNESAGPHPDHHGFAPDPGSPSAIYVIGDGGIYRSSNRGAGGTWQFVGEGIANVEFYDIAQAPTRPGRVIGGTQDNGTVLYDGASTVWKEIWDGDGATVDIDATDANRLYLMEQYISSLRRSTDGGGSFTGIGAGLPTGAVFPNARWQILPNRIMLAAAGSLWRRDDQQGSPWSPIFTPPLGSIVHTAVDSAGPIYYAGSGQGVLHAGPSGGSWQAVFSLPVAPLSVTDIEVDPDDPQTVYMSFEGAGSGRIYRLRRSSPGPTPMAPSDITFDLPTGLAVTAVAVDRMAPLTLYAGTDGGGVYRGRLAGAGAAWHWEPYINGLPSATHVTDLEVHPTTGVLRAATFGRGAFEVNTDYPIGTVLAAEGKMTSLLVQDLGSGYGPPADRIDGEVVIRIDSLPEKAFGFTLRRDADESTHGKMLDLLRDAFRRDIRVRLEYIRTGLRSGRVFRVGELP